MSKYKHIKCCLEGKGIQTLQKHIYSDKKKNLKYSIERKPIYSPTDMIRIFDVWGKRRIKGAPPIFPFSNTTYLACWIEWCMETIFCLQFPWWTAANVTAKGENVITAMTQLPEPTQKLSHICIGIHHTCCHTYSCIHVVNVERDCFTVL